MDINNDILTFRQEVPWFFNNNPTVSYEKTEIATSVEFNSRFPNLTELIQKARKGVLMINQIDHLLYTWDNTDDIICGWLNKVEEKESYFCEPITDHDLLIRNIGGILETFNQPDDSFSNNQNFLFSASQCSRGLGDYEDYYDMSCQDENCRPINYANFLCFSQEANGALTMYDPDNQKVFLFSHDHCFDNVDFMNDQPEYTFHTFKGVITFQDYVEELAAQWLRVLK